jgi:disulfide bond formation protein DsbB
MLFKYGGATGYFVFIIFVALLQFEGFKHIGVYKPQLSSLMRIFYLFIALIFLISGLIKFDMLFIILLAILFMMITSALDLIKNKIISQHEGNKLFPKKTM